MASSGSFRTKGWYSDSKKDYVYLLFEWSIKSQSIANNSTVISWSLKGDRTASGYIKAAPFRVVIDGDTVYSSSTRIELYDGTLVASGTKTLAHNNDGSRSFTASAQGALYSSSINSTGSGSWSLTAIPRQATITSAPNFNDEQSPVLKYSNPAGNAVTSLQACISLDGSASDIAYRDISKTGTSYTFNLTTAERNVLRNACKTAKSRTVKFYIRTTIGGENYHSSVTKTLSIVNAAPTLSPTVTDSNTVTVALTGSNAKFVKYCSNAAFAFNEATLKGATIKSRKVTCGGKSSTSASGTLSAVESGTFVFTVTDSRGFTTSKTLTKTLVNYVKKSCTISGAKYTADGKISFAVKGDAFNGSFGSVANALTVEHRRKESGGSYGSWTAATATKDGNTYSASIALSGLDYTKKYVIQARVTDSIGTTTSAEKTLSCIPVFEWGENDFSFNVNARFRNGGLGIRGTTTNGVDVQAFAPCNANDNCVIGYGPYAEDVGGTNIYGKEISLIGADDILIGNSPSALRSLTKFIDLFISGRDMQVSAVKGASYSAVTVGASLLGNILRCNFSFTRSAAVSGNIANETVATVTINRGGVISGMYNVTFTSGASGHIATFQTAGNTYDTTKDTMTFTISLAATAGSSDAWSGYFLIPVSLNF